MTTSLTFVIPTRNRVELAQRGVGALLDEAGEDLRVVVSDNSTDDAQATRLAAYCAARQDPRLIYVRSPALAMPAHWDWALEQALERSPTSHISVLYDRKAFKPGYVRQLLGAIRDHPQRVVTYTIDQVAPMEPDWVLWQPPTTGRLHEIATARVVAMASRGRIGEMGHAFPILSNCAVPTGLIERIRDRFGDICSSTGPDAAFTFRFCAIETSYLHLDRSLAVIYGSDRSNGLGYLKGTPTDFEDFQRTWGDRPWLDAVPLPGLNLGWNMLFHEYELVRRTSEGAHFPPLSASGYLDGLAYGLPFIVDDDRRREYQDLLTARGWRAGPGAAATPRVVRRRIEAPAARRVLRPLRAAAARLTINARQGWPGRLAVSRFGVVPERINGLRFESEMSALRFALRTTRRDSPHHAGLDWTLEGGASPGTGSARDSGSAVA